MQTLVTLSFILLMIVGTMLPSDGNHGILAPKSLAFLMSAFFFILYFIARWQIKASQAWFALLVFNALFFFGVWYVVGINQDPQIPSGQFDQFKVFMTTLFVPFAGWYLVKEGLITKEKIIRTLIFSNCIYSLIKVSLMVLHLAGIINVWTVMHQTGLRFMSMNIIGEVGRIQTSVDIITPFLLYFVLQSDQLGLKFSKKFKIFYYIVSAASIFLSFSRLLIFAGLLSVFLNGLTLPMAKQIKLWIAVFILSFLGVIAIGPEKVERVIEKRLFSNDNYQSDATRREQIDAMICAYDERPLFGQGLGGYTRECIRDYGLPHAYEVQWVAFLMQFGAFGLPFILAPLCYIAWKLIQPPLGFSKLGYFMLFSLWIVSGFTNPFMISLTSGIVYMLFLFAGESDSRSPA